MHSFKINAKGHGRMEAITVDCALNGVQIWGRVRITKLNKAIERRAARTCASPFDIEERYMNSVESIEEIRWGVKSKFTETKRGGF